MPSKTNSLKKFKIDLSLLSSFFFFAGRNISHYSTEYVTSKNGVNNEIKTFNIDSIVGRSALDRITKKGNFLSFIWKDIRYESENRIRLST